MSLIDEYLSFLEEAAYIKRVAKGLLKDRGALRRIRGFAQKGDPLAAKAAAKAKGLKGENLKKAIERATKEKPMLKSKKRYEAGIERGTHNIVKKKGIKVSHVPDPTFAKFVNRASAEGAFEKAHRKRIGRLVPGKTITRSYGSHMKSTPGGKKVIHIKKGSKDPYIKRHEADEARAAIKAEKGTRKIGSIVAPTGAGGTHVSDEVLRRERELLRVGTRLHKSKRAGKLRSFRKMSGEYEDLGTKKQIAKAEKQVRKAAGKSFSHATPEGRLGYASKKQLRKVLARKDYKTALKRATKTPTILSKPPPMKKSGAAKEAIERMRAKRKAFEKSRGEFREKIKRASKAARK